MRLVAGKVDINIIIYAHFHDYFSLLIYFFSYVSNELASVVCVEPMEISSNNVTSTNLKVTLEVGISRPFLRPSFFLLIYLYFLFFILKPLLFLGFAYTWLIKQSSWWVLWALHGILFREDLICLVRLEASLFVLIIRNSRWIQTLS